MIIGGKELPRGIIQGGMGVGVSLANLAGSVAREGCMGVISSVNIGFNDALSIANVRPTLISVGSTFILDLVDGMNTLFI